MSFASTPSIYVIGGSDSSGHVMGTVEKYDTSTNTWETVAPMPTARHYLAAVGFHGSIYAIGGITTGCPPISPSPVEKYDPSTNTWGTGASMPTARYAFGAVASHGFIYAIGGGNCSVSFSTVEKYNPSADKWTTVAPMPTARVGLAAATDSHGSIYAIGGNNGVSLNTVEKYGPSNSWTTVAPMPTARWGLAAATGADGSIYAMGGRDIDGNSLNIVEKYNPSTNTWTTVVPLPTARINLAATVPDAVTSNFASDASENDGATTDSATASSSTSSPSNPTPGSFGDFTITQPKMVSYDGQELNKIQVGQQVGVSSVLTNHNFNEKKFTYIVQVLNNKGQTEYLEGLSASMVSGQSFTAVQAWAPQEPGKYTIQIFVWSSLASPIPITNPIDSTITVV